MISGSVLLSLFVWIIVVGLIFWLLWWFLGYLALPQPFDKVIRVIVVLAAVVFLINALLSIAGHPLVR